MNADIFRLIARAREQLLLKIEEGARDKSGIKMALAGLARIHTASSGLERQLATLQTRLDHLEAADAGRARRLRIDECPGLFAAEKGGRGEGSLPREIVNAAKLLGHRHEQAIGMR